MANLLNAARIVTDWGERKKNWKTRTSGCIIKKTLQNSFGDIIREEAIVEKS